MAQIKTPERVLSFVNSLGKSYPGLKSVYLFGSHAKGDSRSDSDIDLAFVFEHADNTFDLQVSLMKERRHYDTRIEPHVFREEDFHSSSLAGEILKTGSQIWG